mgnify:CR=1 FL=1
MTEKLFLIDAMAMIYRAYFALISNPLLAKGHNVSAVYGFVNSLIKILEDEKPEHIAVCFDTEKPTFRHKEFPKYKAQREEIPTDMQPDGEPQLPGGQVSQRQEQSGKEDAYC